MRENWTLSSKAVLQFPPNPIEKLEEKNIKSTAPCGIWTSDVTFALAIGFNRCCPHHNVPSSNAIQVQWWTSADILGHNHHFKKREKLKQVLMDDRLAAARKQLIIFRIKVLGQILSCFKKWLKIPILNSLPLWRHNFDQSIPIVSPQRILKKRRREMVTAA